MTSRRPRTLPDEAAHLMANVGGLLAQCAIMSRSSSSGPHRILVAEDSSDIRKLWRLCLTYAGFRVDEAGNGAQALNLARRQRPDVVLMDLQMPVMGGEEAIRQLRADPVTADVTIIVLSAQGTEESVNAARLAGADAYLDKPVMPDLLLKYIRKVFNRRRYLPRQMVRVPFTG